MITAVIIDDEISALETLEIELRAYCPQVKVVAKCNSTDEGLLAIEEHSPDVLFLDIEMPKMNAFEFLDRLNEITFDIVFVTGYDRYAVKAFEVNAVDYLLKPIQKSKLISAVDKIEEKRHRGIDDQQLQELRDVLLSRQLNYPNIALPTLEGYDFVKIDKIIYAQADSNYTKIVLSDGKQLVLSKTLKEIENMLSGHYFVRVHQSYLISMNHISKYVKGSGGYAIMSNGDTINVSRSYKRKLLDLLKSK